jgi:peptide deformylase
VFVNPEIVRQRNDRKVYEEGCLSVPGIYDERRASRPHHACARSTSTGLQFTLDADGLLAVCLQHEIDHLKGRVFVQYLSRLKQYGSAPSAQEDREAA